VTVRSPVRARVHDEELTVAGGQGRPRRAFGPPQRQGGEERPLQQRLHEAGAEPRGLLARVRADDVQRGRAQQAHSGGDRVRGEDDIGVAEDQHVAGGCLGQLRARVRFAEPPGR
jgi:hypothetical protein